MSSVGDVHNCVVKLIEIDQCRLCRDFDVWTLARSRTRLTRSWAPRPLRGAKNYERSPGRIGNRACCYDRRFRTNDGKVPLCVPELRRATFQRQAIERYKHREMSEEEELVGLCLAGVSAWRVEDITDALLSAVCRALLP